jgi:TolB-like protein
MEAAPSIRIVRATVPDDLEDTIMRALEKVPADRFPTVSQFKEALLGGSTTTTAIRRVTRRTTTSRVAIAEQEDLLRRRRPLKIAAIVAAGVVVVAAALGLYGLRGRSHTAASAGAIDARELAVLYLDDDSKDSSLRHVADGLTESLISQLGRVEGLHVVSPGGVAPYRNTTVPDDSVGRALKVGVLVKGSIVQQGSAYKVSLKLVDGQGGGDIDRRSFTVAQKDLLTARDSVARVTADLLRGPLGSEVRLRELRGATKSIDAWTLVQRVENAKKDADRLTAASDPDGALKRLSEADSLAARAAALDDKWPEPLVQRGAIAYQLARLTKDPNTLAAFVQAGLGHAGRALELDPRSADALELRGSLKYYRISRGLVSGRAESTTLIDEAEKDLRDAVAIAPNQATAWNALSVLQYAKQNVVDSHAYAQKAYEADAYLRSASDILWRLYATSYDLEQFPDAMKWCAEGQRRFPVSSRFIWCQLYLMLSKAVPADPDEAWTLAGQIEKLTPKQDLDLERRQAHMLVAIVLGRAKLVDSAHKVILRTRAGADVDPRGEVMGLEALARTFLGERDAAITLLEQYLTSHPDHRAGFAKVNAWWWRDLQQEPRFKTLAGAGR